MVLKKEELIEVAGSNGFGELAYQYSITPKGVVRVHQILERTTYVGPAPVTVDHYRRVIMAQAISTVRVGPTEVREALSDLVLEDHVMDAMGQAVNTGRSLFLFGPPGNGKTMLAEHIVPLLGGEVLIPHTFTVDGQIIKVLDLHNHVPVQVNGRPDFDRRFVLCRRPAIITGGELTLEGLDLVYDKFARIYEAPLQLKANGGMLLIDDFGRQQVSPRQLLNRWIVPLEKRVDYLTLHTGKKIEIPFDQLIVFSTNLQPKDLVDEAFLRRIQNKIHVTNPSVDIYREIFRRQCDALGVPFDQNGLVYLLREYYVKPKRELRSVHPRDILRTLIGIARYHNISPVLSPKLLDRACQTYFVDL
jgi:predicted ATPase with chaperone activity